MLIIINATAKIDFRAKTWSD